MPSPSRSDSSVSSSPSRPASASPTDKKKKKKKAVSKKKGRGSATERASATTARQVFEEAYSLCASGSFKKAVELLSMVSEMDRDNTFEAKALPGMLLLCPDSQDGDRMTMLHWAAWHGDEVKGIRDPRARPPALA